MDALAAVKPALRDLTVKSWPEFPAGTEVDRLMFSGRSPIRAGTRRLIRWAAKHSNSFDFRIQFF